MSKARLCLLNSQQKRKYDERLRTALTLDDDVKLDLDENLDLDGAGAKPDAVPMAPPKSKPTVRPKLITAPTPIVIAAPAPKPIAAAKLEPLPELELPPEPYASSSLPSPSIRRRELPLDMTPVYVAGGFAAVVIVGLILLVVFGIGGGEGRQQIADPSLPVVGDPLPVDGPVDGVVDGIVDGVAQAAPQPESAAAVEPPSTGQLVIDSEVEVVIRSNGKIVRHVTLRAGANRFTLPAGTIEVKPVDGSAEFDISSSDSQIAPQGSARFQLRRPRAYLLASGGDDNTIKLWSPVTGRELGTLTGHVGYVNPLIGNGGNVHSVAFSPLLSEPARADR